MVDGCTKLYTDDTALAPLLSELEADGFDQHVFEALDWNKDSRFDWDYMKKFNDGHAEYSTETYHKTLPEGNGYVFVVKDFGLHYFKNPIRAHAALKTMKDLAWLYLMFGKKLLIFLQVQDYSFNQHLHESGEKPIGILDHYIERG